MKFRTDINGLRALAVIAVVLFHFNPSWVPGGFAGVDVFFVISGFLMTGLIFRGLENNNFSIINFYVARANRIIPALSVVCLVLLVFSYYYINVIDNIDVINHIVSSVGFFSNVIYWRESGYFDTASHSKWLLHTWSLSVEWQFYMIYPVVLVLLKKCMSLDNIKRLLVVGTILGFIFSVYATYRWPNPAYFLFPTRAWEMMIGGLAFLYPLQNLKEASKKYLERVGIALILVAYAFISKDNLWPGYLALIPVLGAYLVIIANRSGSVITDNVVMQKVGLWSYSIYLWHWPIVVFGYYFEMQYWEWIGIPISVVLGFCSYKFIESIKFSKLENLSIIKVVTIKPILILMFTITLCFISLYTSNFYSLPKEFRVSNQEFRNLNEGHIGLYPKGNEPLYINSNENDFQYILIGDSYARHYYSFFKDNGVKIVSFAVDGCYSTKNYASKNNDLTCVDAYSNAVEFIVNHPGKKIILAQNWESINKSKNLNKRNDDFLQKEDFYINEINEFIADIKGSYHDLYIIGANQGSKVVPFKYMSGMILKSKLQDNYSQEYSNNIASMKLFKNQKKIGYKFIDPSPALCEQSECFIIKDKKPIYTDYGHLTKFGSNIVGNYFFNKIKSS